MIISKEISEALGRAMLMESMANSDLKIMRDYKASSAEPDKSVHIFVSIAYNNLIKAHILYIESYKAIIKAVNEECDNPRVRADLIPHFTAVLAEHVKKYDDFLINFKF